jgi:hypothetical protein
MDIQAASAMGAFVRSSYINRGGNVGVQQFTNIARGTGNEAWAVSVSCDCYGAEWGGLKREFDAERRAIAESVARFFGNDG